MERASKEILEQVREDMRKIDGMKPFSKSEQEKFNVYARQVRDLSVKLLKTADMDTHLLDIYGNHPTSQLARYMFAVFRDTCDEIQRLVMPDPNIVSAPTSPDSFSMRLIGLNFSVQQGNITKADPEQRLSERANQSNASVDDKIAYITSMVEESKVMSQLLKRQMEEIEKNLENLLKKINQDPNGEEAMSLLGYKKAASETLENLQRNVSIIDNMLSQVSKEDDDKSIFKYAHQVAEQCKTEVEQLVNKLKSPQFSPKPASRRINL